MATVGKVMVFIVTLWVSLFGCTQHNIRVQKYDARGKPTGPILVCKLAVWHNEGGPDYSGCSDGLDHGMSEPYIEVTK